MSLKLPEFSNTAALRSFKSLDIGFRVFGFKDECPLYV